MTATIAASRTVALPYGLTAPPNSILSWQVKNPGDILDYTFDISGWLGEDGSTISTASVSSASGITVALLTPWTSGLISVQISGGTAGVTYAVTFSIALSSGETLVRTVYSPVGTVGIPNNSTFQTSL